MENSLEVSPPTGAREIKWNMNVGIDGVLGTATSPFSHTCYPGHIVKINNTTIYSYLPTQNNTMYAFGCLFGGFPLVSGMTSPVAVPPKLLIRGYFRSHLMKVFMLFFVLLGLGVCRPNPFQLEQMLNAALSPPHNRTLPNKDQLLRS